MTKRKKTPRTTRKLSTLGDFLASEDRREEVEAVAVKEVLAWQIAKAMKANSSHAAGLPGACEPAGARSAVCSIPGTET